LQEPTTELSPEARQAALIVNRLRIEAGLPPLAVHPLLNLAVTQHIQDMVTTGHYGHSGSDGSNVRQRIARTGYAIDGWAGENWAVSETVEQSIEWWMADRPHRENVLNRSYKEMGLGTYPHPKGWGLILVVDFSTGSSNQAPGVVIVPENANAAVPSVEIVASPPAISQSGARYTIQPGDTLSSIGQRYGLSWQEIAQANGLGEFSVLQLGNQLVLPGIGSLDQQASISTSQAIAPLVDNIPVTVNDTIHIVVPGDTIFAIAMEHGLTWQTLASYNNLAENDILSIGAQLKIPAPDVGGGPSLPTQLPGRRYIVQPGETLWSIAATNSVDWHELMAINNMGEDIVLTIGQEIRLP
jgi:LysM repeat protein